MDFVTPSASQAPFFLALDRGFYKDECLNVDIGMGQTSAVTGQVVATKQDVFGWADASVVAPQISDGAPVVMVAGILQQTPTASVSLDKKGILKPKDLIGKTVGLTVGGSAAQQFDAMLKVNGIDPNQVTKQNLASTAVAPALLSGQIDAGITSLGTVVTIQSQAQQQGMKTNELWFSDYGVTVLAHGIIVHQDTIQQNPDLVRRFVRASLKGWAAAVADPNAAVQAQFKSHPEANVGILSAQLALFLKLLHTDKTKGQPIGFQSADDWQSMLDFLTTYSGMKTRKPVQTYFTNDFLPK